MSNLAKWTQVTSELPWGVQRVLHDTLSLVAEDKVSLIHSQDYANGSPCLINAVGQMLTTGGGQGIPVRHFSNLVILFDNINREFQEILGYNSPDDFKVSPAVGEVLVRYFAPLKDKPIDAAVNEAMAMEAFANHVYVEPKDEDLAREWLNTLQEEVTTEDVRVTSS